MTVGKATLEKGAFSRQRSSSLLFATGARHVHIGAGRLGLGLIVSALAENEKLPLFILEVPNPAWDPLFRVSRGGNKPHMVTLVVNNEKITDLAIVTNIDQYRVYLGKVKEMGLPPKMLIISLEEDLLSLVASEATSVSCALGPFLKEGVTSFLKRGGYLDEKPHNPASKLVVYACENDHNAVEKLALELKDYATVVPVLVDRICSNRKIGPKSISIEAEAFAGEIVVKMPEEIEHEHLEDDVDYKDDRSPWENSDQVVTVDRNDMWNFFRRKKLLCVNGKHTTLAFLTLVENEPKDHIGLPSGDYTLITWETATKEQQAVIWSWMVARVMMLLSEFSCDVIFEALFEHDVDKDKIDIEHYCIERLMNYTILARDRISKMNDTTSRILSGGVVNRYETRLCIVNDFLNQNQELAPLYYKLLKFTNLSEKKMRDDVAKLCQDSKRFAIPNKDKNFKTSILFDFDGTLCNSERPAMKVAFVELAPYIPEELSATIAQNFMRLNAGKAFELMVDSVEAQRFLMKLPSIEQTREDRSEDPERLAHVDQLRANIGLQTIASMRSEEAGVNPDVLTEPRSILIQQRRDVLVAIGRFASATEGTVDCLRQLENEGFPFCIATTSGKPRVSVSVDAVGLREFFPTDMKIHSGKSDFQPPRFKPAPDVYLKAALMEGKEPLECIAVEDSPTGVGAAVNAKIGLVVGYVGADHIEEDQKANHAIKLLNNAKSKKGTGAHVVLKNMKDLPALVRAFNKWRIELIETPDKKFDLTSVVKNFKYQYWLP